MQLVVTIGVWDAWKVVALVCGVRTALDCLAAWSARSPGGDWRGCAWHCEWCILGFLGGVLASAATLQLASLEGDRDAAIWLVALALVGLRALLGLPEPARACLRRWGPDLRLRQLVVPRARRAGAVTTGGLLFRQGADRG